MERKLALDDDPELLRAIFLLKKEIDARRNNKKVPVITDEISSEDLRNLPAFLEPIGIYLQYNPATFKTAYGIFSEEVMLCAESTYLWEGDVPYDKSAYWRSFAAFVQDTKKHGYTLWNGA